MNNKIFKVSLIAFITLLLVTGIAFSYAYFTMNIVQIQKLTVLNSGDLKLRYTDNTELSLENALPGDSIVKTFTVENIGSKKVSYNIIWNNLINTINNYDLQLDMKCKSYKDYNTSSKTESGECSSFYKAVPYTETSISKDIKRNNEIDVGITHEYTVTITFKNRSYNQNDNLNKSFSGKIDLEEYVDPSPNEVYCTYGGTLTAGAEFINGKYTYRYAQKGNYTDTGSEWTSTDAYTWGVQLTDKDSTDPVSGEICTYIDNLPVAYYDYLFANSQASSIDVSSFNTKQVKSMLAMFRDTVITSLDLSNFDTSKVLWMNSMFMNVKLTTIDLSNFDTSKVLNMNGMFAQNSLTSIVGLDNFDTSSLIDMGMMFQYSKVTSLDLSSFDTSRVINMQQTFWNSSAAPLDVSNFNTSNVTTMSNLFNGVKNTILDLSSFDTSNVGTMGRMFAGMTNLKTIYVSNKFVTDKVTSGSGMFTDSTNLVGGAGTKYNGSYIDKTYARIDGGTSNPGYFTAKN